jgi:hypothetical protein
VQRNCLAGEQVIRSEVIMIYGDAKLAQLLSAAVSSSAAAA